MWPIPMEQRARLALTHEPSASESPDSFRLATCVCCERTMVAMWHLWLDAEGLKKEIHMCHRCATDFYGAPFPDNFDEIQDQVVADDFVDVY